MPLVAKTDFTESRAYPMPAAVSGDTASELLVARLQKPCGQQRRVLSHTLYGMAPARLIVAAMG
ncbi:hypothetical protein [Roseobacter sp. MED193]|jgi:hypothetical protein|uniref:hypothetical protein n=1 Tax=Roseobacter sp. MED193 TaxID=314262 RepID=UPI0012ED5DFF|nr:hypothetical protein [Roseobacter sp. MED193]